MSDNSKKYETRSEKFYPNVRLIDDPEQSTTTGGTKLLRVRFYDESKSPKHVNVPVEATVSLEKRPFLAKLKKGDSIQVRGKEEYRLYPSKSKSAVNGVMVGAEIRFPNLFEPLTNLRDRPDAETAEEPANETTGGGEGEKGGSFFGED